MADKFEYQGVLHAWLLVLIAESSKKACKKGLRCRIGPCEVP
jgi:hypothetical protein